MPSIRLSENWFKKKYDVIDYVPDEISPEVKRTLAQEFFDFLKTFGIIGLAIAFVIGQAASKLVTAFVDDIITPLIGLFLPAGDLKAMSFTVGKSKFMWSQI